MKSGAVSQKYIEPIFGLKTVRTAALAVAIEVRMSKKLSTKDATLSKEMMKIVRMRLMGLRMTSPPKVEVKPKVLDEWRRVVSPFYPTPLSTSIKRVG